MRDNHEKAAHSKSTTKMNQETQDFLDFVDQEFNPGSVSIDSLKEYLKRLPGIYSNDLSFRLLFDWHWDLNMNIGRTAYKNPSICIEDPIFSKQIQLITTAGLALHDLNYQYRELILYHARVDLRGKSLLEIGGSLPNDLLFEHLGVESYINIESRDYIESESGTSYSSKHGDHERRKTIFCNAEEIDKQVKPESIDTIFSVACFEHIYDLSAALEACHACSNRGGTLFSYFAPIYSRIDEGDHGVIPKHKLFNESLLDFTCLRPKTRERNCCVRELPIQKKFKPFWLESILTEFLTAFFTKTMKVYVLSPRITF